MSYTRIEIWNVFWTLFQCSTPTSPTAETDRTNCSGGTENIKIKETLLANKLGDIELISS
jgi:hypothetical protein